ncbi:hypothetical protein PFISCL1PPCAC_2204, partial [Pristionchus fissidentatus]
LLQSMTRRVQNENGETFTLFFTVVSPFSNFHPCLFREEDHEGEMRRFSCVEQFYMFMKAAVFDDIDTAEDVMKERNPKRMKSLGKNVKGFQQQRWDQLSPQVMKKALTAKFSQNEKLRRYLFLTQGSQMVEASPMDTVWGIGLPMDSPDAINPRRWRGTNRLGKIMTEVREALVQQKEFLREAQDAQRDIHNQGSRVFDDLPSDPQSSGGSAFNTPQSGFKRRNAESDPRDAKRQRTMDDFVSTPNSSHPPSFYEAFGKSRFGEREVKTEPRKRAFQDDRNDNRDESRERYGSRDRQEYGSGNRHEHGSGGNRQEYGSGGNRLEHGDGDRQEHGGGDQQEYGSRDRQDTGIRNRQDYGSGNRQEFDSGNREEYGSG